LSAEASAKADAPTYGRRSSQVSGSPWKFGRCSPTEENFLDALGDHELTARLGLAELLRDAVIEKSEQRVVVAILVEQDSRFVVLFGVLVLERPLPTRREFIVG